MKKSLRNKFFDWLVKIFNISPNVVLPKYLCFVKAVLFPVDYICYKQQTLKYDMCRDAIWIDGVVYDRRMFKMLKVGEVFEVIKTEGVEDFKEYSGSCFCSRTKA